MQALAFEPEPKLDPPLDYRLDSPAVTSVNLHPAFSPSDIPERKEKRYKEVALATEKILNLLGESQRLFRADENSEAWWDYLVTMARSARPL